MQASNGRLYLGFWSLSLRNLPTGGIQHRLVDTATAAQLIYSARNRGMLQCAVGDTRLVGGRIGSRG